MSLAPEQKQSPIFVTSNGTLTIPSFLLLTAIPLFVSGSYWWGWTAVVLGFGMALCTAAMDHSSLLQEEDKLKITYDIMEPDDVLEELTQIETGLKATNATNTDARARARHAVLAGLAALAKKYARLPRNSKKTKKKGAQDDVLPTAAASNMAVSCQEAAYIGFRTFPSDDEVVAASLSLLAVVAKQEVVRERHLYEADVCGLNQPIECLKTALDRSKELEDVKEDEELLAAELQRKGCLLLGALCDGSPELARLVVEEGGLKAILDGVEWYRCHEEVVNWGLWALFILCYEHPPNKVALVEYSGVSVILQAMENCGAESEKVSRHGIAILFDIMREKADNSNTVQSLDAYRIRNTALAAGLHPILLSAMENYTNAMDIMMMGQEILVGTGYTGDVPQYHPTR